VGPLSQREKGGRARRSGGSWAGCWVVRGPRGKGKEGGVARGGEREREVSGPAWPMRDKGKGRGELGWAKGFGLLSFLLFFPFLFYSQTFKQNYLNLHKFEFKPYTLNTN
jgi:hypothetical protein